MSDRDYDNSNKGVLFVNKKRRKDTKDPNLTGSMCFVVPKGARPGDKIEYWLSGWTKKEADGKFKLCSLAIKPKDRDADEPRRGDSYDDGDEDSPF